MPLCQGLIYNFQSDKYQYVNTLQPKYSSVDLTEVELPEMDTNNANSNMDREDENTNMLLDVCIIFYIFYKGLLLFIGVRFHE